MKNIAIKLTQWLLMMSSLQLFAMELPTAQTVIEIQSSNVEGENFIILKNFPGVLNVKQKSKELFQCLTQSLHEKKAVKLEIDKQHFITACRLP